MKMMKMSHRNDLTDAQAHPSESSSPNMARFRGTTDPAPSARWAIVLHPHPSAGQADGAIT
jgi:hypothetical protein